MKMLNQLRSQMNRLRKRKLEKLIISLTEGLKVHITLTLQRIRFSRDLEIGLSGVDRMS